MNEKLKRILLKIGKLLLIPLIFFGIWAIYQYTNLFVLTNINIVTLSTDKLEYIKDEEVFMIESLQQEYRYFEVDVNKISNEVTDISTFIDLAYVSKEFPNVLNIYIKEKIPFITLEIDEKKCILLDSNSFVLDISENNCDENTKKYSTITVKSDDPKIVFVEDTQSSYFQLNQINKVLKVLNEYKVPVTLITLKDNVATFSSTRNKVYIFSFNQDLEVQLARFVAVVNELENKGLKFKTIDLRFKRPVLSTKANS